jgi:2-polyprenyl-3-methyl-5-hydroxy-6-metoxy-1,4-benzoquinol methylase
MPTSYPLYKDSVRNWVLQNIPSDAKILDVGAGCGTYSDLLRGYGYKIDAVEIWKPYIDKY